MATDAPSPGEAANALLVPIRTALPWQRIGVWLRRGCSDYRACWPLSSWFGLCFVAMEGCSC